MGVKSLMGDIRGMGSNLRRFGELISPPCTLHKSWFSANLKPRVQDGYYIFLQEDAYRNTMSR